MLSLSTSLLRDPPQPFSDQVRSILDAGIPGVVVGAEIATDQVPALVREAKGAGYAMTALEAPRPVASAAAKSQHPRLRCPSLASGEETQRQLAEQSTLDAISLADRHEINVVIVSIGAVQPGDLIHRCEQVIADTDAKLDQLEAVATRDPRQKLLAKRWTEQQQRQLRDLARPDEAMKQRRQVALDALLRSLDPLLEQASRRGIRLALRETCHIGGLIDRSGFLEVYQVFHGAPLRLVADPAAATALSILHGLDQVPPLPEDQDLIEGCYLRDLSGTRPGALLGDGDLDLAGSYDGYSDESTRILEAPMGTAADRIAMVARTCRELGIDGAPPPVPGDPIPIIGGK
ncbi:MAG TPA: hypothetical protein EYN40_07205 [Planctomycetes bacterium]|nr:hypothetical protein [Planctomycetota bacterium]